MAVAKTLQEAIERVENALSTWHDHADPNAVLRDAQLAFMKVAANTVAGLHVRLLSAEASIEELTRRFDRELTALHKADPPAFAPSRVKK